MKINYINLAGAIFMAAIVSLVAVRCSGSKKTADNADSQVITTNETVSGPLLTVYFTRGESHNHPLMAIWLEDMDGKYIETLYVAESVGKGIFRHGSRNSGIWSPGEVRRPAALPYWSHKRGIKAPDGLYLPTPEEPVPDAITGPTPAGDFTLKSKAVSPLPDTFKLMLEINQSWDWNEFWTNNKYPDDDEYKTSSQPALVYETVIDLADLKSEYELQPVGHSHYAGLDGILYPDLSTLTTAMKIAGSISVTVHPNN